MLKLFFSTFALIFLAELGDKTQLATLAITSQAKQPGGPWIVFGGAALALVATSAIAVLAGGYVARSVPPHLIRWISGLLFIAAGTWTLIKG
jgi:putative Ca2+/H+ antiporter (TMEM165/GDT1 family)